MDTSKTRKKKVQTKKLNGKKAKKGKSTVSKAPEKEQEIVDSEKIPVDTVATQDTQEPGDAKVGKKKVQTKKLNGKKAKKGKSTVSKAPEKEQEIVDSEKIPVDTVATQDTQEPGDAKIEEETVPEKGIELEEDEEDVQNLLEFLVFRLSDEYYAFKLSDLKEVVKEQIITFVPKMPSFIVGITSLRGKIIPVVNLNIRLSIEKKVSGKTKRQILIVNGQKGPIGMMIDRVIGVRRIEETYIHEPPSHLDDKQIKFIESVVRDNNTFISILNLQEILSFEPTGESRRT